MSNENLLAIGAVAVVILAVVLGFFEYKDLTSELAETRAELASRTENLRLTTEALRNQEDQNRQLADALYREEEKVREIEGIVSELGSTVGTLEKLAETDPELLQKYSKVYFLNEHYVPSSLVSINSEFVSEEDREEGLQIHGKVWPHLEDLLEDAQEDGIELRVTSAFRSFGEQSDLKASYRVTYGEGSANQFSAEQGYSEHQLGTTVDFSTEALAGGLAGFQNTEAYAWLQDNAHKYGFTLSYPEGNQFYVFEPWHWRYVGVELATDLHNDGLHFYDLTQREIDEYLVSIFD